MVCTLDSNVGFIEMIKRKITRLLMFLGFAIAIWILCTAYAVTSLGDYSDKLNLLYSSSRQQNLPNNNP